jgi:hypothetical protein
MARKVATDRPALSAHQGALPPAASARQTKSTFVLLPIVYVLRLQGTRLPRSGSFRHPKRSQRVIYKIIDY